MIRATRFVARGPVPGSRKPARGLRRVAAAWPPELPQGLPWPLPQLFGGTEEVAAANARDAPELFFVTKKAPPITFANEDWALSDLVAAIRAGEVAEAYIDAGTGRAELIDRDGDHSYAQLPPGTSGIQLLLDHGVRVHYQYVTGGAGAGAGAAEEESEGPVQLARFFLQTVGVYALLAVVFMLAQRAMGGGGGPGGIAGRFGSGVGKQFNVETDVLVTFENVAGAENAKEDLAEVIGFLRKTEDYTRMGARIPKGILMVGPPGTGKTLMARAVAGEAQVPFFSCSASEFIEMFVGVGASRIRDLFRKAKEQAPCILFIDEIDAVGKKRSGGVAGANDERDQTINQLLTEMDGFSNNHGVIVMAATNRPELLDDALTRPGRFDRQVALELPNAAGRRKILELYLRDKPVAAGTDIERLAGMTIGFSGAELENLCNEAAIYSARRGHTEIAAGTFEVVFDNITMGPESKTNLVTENMKRVLAYHEAGHALVGVLVGEYDALRKVSIVARRNAGGLTFFEPSEEGLYTREYLNNRLVVLMAGRAAEEILFGPAGVTTGASNDLEVATTIAEQMVANLGFSEHIGHMSLAGSDTIAGSIGTDVALEARGLLETAYARATELLVANRPYLDAIAATLIERETLGRDEVYDILWGVSCPLPAPGALPETPTDPYDDG